MSRVGEGFRGFWSQPETGTNLAWKLSLALFSGRLRWVIIPSLPLMQVGIFLRMGVPFVQFSAGET